MRKNNPSRAIRELGIQGLGLSFGMTTRQSLHNHYSVCVLKIKTNFAISGPYSAFDDSAGGR
jgi:hypothetical protein